MTNDAAEVVKGYHIDLANGTAEIVTFQQDNSQQACPSLMDVLRSRTEDLGDSDINSK